MAYIQKEPLCAWLENMNVSDFIIRRIKSEEHFPTADVVEVKHGEWTTKVSDMWHCSLCLHPALLNGCEEDVLSNYCPNCGARMYGTPKERGGEK